MQRDTTRQIPASSYLWRTDTKIKCPVTDSNCCVATRHPVYTLFTVPPPSKQVNSSPAARTLCGIGIESYVATFLVFHLLLSRLYLARLENASPVQTWPARRLRSRELEDTCTNTVFGLDVNFGYFSQPTLINRFFTINRQDYFKLDLN